MAQPGAYQDALEALDRPGVVQLIRQLQMTWFGLAVAGAEKGLAGVPGPVLGLTDLAAVTPALVLKPGYQRDEARMDMRILLERMFGTTQLTSVLIRSRSGPQSSAFHNVRAR